MDNKKLSFLWIAAAALLAACASSDQDDMAVGGSDHGPVITLTTNSAEGTMRAATTDVQQNSGNFLNGEKVDIFFKDAHTGSEEKSTYPQPLTYTSDGAGNLAYGTAQYWPKLMHPLSAWGVYPSGLCDANALTADKTYEFSVATNQSAFSKEAPDPMEWTTKEAFLEAHSSAFSGMSDDEKTAAWNEYVADYEAQVDAAKGYKGSDLMIGLPTTAYDNYPGTVQNPLTQVPEMSSGDVGLTFKHMLSKIIVNIRATDATDNAVKAQLTSAKVTILNTKNKAKFSVTEQKLIENGTGTGNYAYDDVATDITARKTEEVTTYDAEHNPSTTTNYNGQDVAAIIVPQKLNAGTRFIKIETETGDDGPDTFVYSIPTGDMTFESGKAYEYTITIHKSSITVTSTIKPWEVQQKEGNGYLD